MPIQRMSYTEECTYEKLLQFGEEPSVSCECLFVDPIADIAVLGMPDEQELSEEAEGYEALVEAATPLIIAARPPVAEQVDDLAQFGLDQKAAMHECPARILSLAMVSVQGQVFLSRNAEDRECRTRHHGRHVGIADHYGGRQGYCLYWK
jgi:hypothetical protein